jgi:hypothetical protein
MVDKVAKEIMYNIYEQRNDIYEVEGKRVVKDQRRRCYRRLDID